MFSSSQNRKKVGADTLLDAGIFPVNPATAQTQIDTNGVSIGVPSNLDIHQVEITCTDSTGVVDGGQIAFLAKGSGENAQWQPVQKDGADFILDMDATGIRSFDIPNSSLSAIAAVPTATVSLTVGTQWTLNIISGRKG